jgi:hypothetical protein
MVSLSLARIISISSAFLCFARVSAVPVNATIFDGLDQQARDILVRATPVAPHWVIYSDQFVSGTTGPPAVSAVTVGIYSERRQASIGILISDCALNQGLQCFRPFVSPHGRGLRQGGLYPLECTLNLIVFRGFRVDDLDRCSKGICQSPVQCRRD